MTRGYDRGKVINTNIRDGKHCKFGRRVDLVDGHSLYRCIPGA